jgi:hypothetical protein
MASKPRLFDGFGSESLESAPWQRPSLLPRHPGSRTLGWEDAARRALTEWHAKLIALLERSVATVELRAASEIPVGGPRAAG